MTGFSQGREQRAQALETLALPQGPSYSSAPRRQGHPDLRKSLSKDWDMEA